ncbi:GIY-YIG nuclease family protein [Roseiconus lacunae]|uniref:GIY-YIG nuclease family protein n=1 Tax=Roseiconus lacunae TaxID=2605694 RepID=UPI001E4C79D3|nr:GIY-YIG nuclease family protein [Roseiconus lacunae]MCD0459091.1 GIY-YIG nuclease family protein [Roseiconus lacunae]
MSPEPGIDDYYAGAGSLFLNLLDSVDTESETIYIARSLSDNEFVKANREVLHKIGVTGGAPVTRSAEAKKDPRYLLAESELVATYKLANINRKALETLLHNFFAKARLDVALADRFGDKVCPREWFLVPLPVIAEVADRIKEGSIMRYRYEVLSASLVPRA